MAKDTYYFSHDFGARNDPKLQTVLMKLGHVGKSVFWDLVEMLYEQGGYLNLNECESYAFALRTDCECINRLISDFGLFKKDKNRFWSESVLRRLAKRNEKSEKAAKSAKTRWDNPNAYKKDANALRPESDGNAIKEKKGNKNKSNQIILSIYGEASIHKKIIDYLNLVAGTKYKHETKSTVDLINARLKEKYTVDDFLIVIDKMVNKWINDPEYSRYLRPETLFGNKFESYLNLIHVIKIDTGNSKSIKILEDSNEFKKRMGWN